jgi:uncharacterized membrane protein
MGVVLPSLLTIIFLLWLWNAISTYVLRPIEAGARHLVVARIAEIHPNIPKSIPQEQIERNLTGDPIAFTQSDKKFVRLASGEWVPEQIVRGVVADPGPQFPTTAESLYDRYVQRRWIRPGTVIPIVLSVFLLLVYLLGKFIAARVGAILLLYFERLIDRLPLINTVYGTVKQVTDIVFSETELQYSRVVAVQYPREGIWSIGFVTGESLRALNNLTGEPMLAVLMPTSPMPATGFTITVRKRDAIDLNITLDQAFQFIVSCGVVAAGRSKEAPRAEVTPFSPPLRMPAMEGQLPWNPPPSTDPTSKG